jgi:hypothetical protein
MRGLFVLNIRLRVREGGRERGRNGERGRGGRERGGVQNEPEGERIRKGNRTTFVNSTIRGFSDAIRNSLDGSSVFEYTSGHRSSSHSVQPLAGRLRCC